MDNEDSCDSCVQKDRCQEVYRRLGKTEGPCVTYKVLGVFLAPLVVFIVSLAVFQEITGRTPRAEQLSTGVSVAGALCATFLCILTVRAIGNRRTENK